MKNRPTHFRFAMILISFIATGIAWSQDPDAISQVVINTRFIEVTDDQLEELGIDWTTPASAGLFGFSGQKRRRAGVDPGTPGTTTATDGTSLSSGLGMIDPSILVPNPKPGFKSSGRFGPVILDDAEVQTIMRAVEREGLSILSAPKVTMFSGQVATVDSFITRPFAVGLEPVSDVGGIGFEPTLFSRGETIFEIGGGAALGALSGGGPKLEDF